MDQRSWMHWCALWINDCQRVLKPEGYFLMFTDWRQLPAASDALQMGGLIWRGIVAWNNGTDCYAGQTSDSLYFYTMRVDYLLQFIKIFSHFNSYAMSQDVFFRGGIAKGSLARKEQYQFYGDSIVKAYLLESVVADKPLIYMDDGAYNSLVKLNKTESICSLIETCKDRHFLKPFVWDISLQFLFNETIQLETISKNLIIENIEKNRKKFEYDPKNFNKYIFLKEQYNNCTRKENK